LTGLALPVLQIKTNIVSYHTANSKPVKLEVNGTVILTPLVLLGHRYRNCLIRFLIYKIVMSMFLSTSTSLAISKFVATILRKAIFLILNILMEQHLFTFSLIIGGTTEKVLQLIRQIRSIYNKSIDFIEQSCIWEHNGKVKT